MSNQFKPDEMTWMCKCFKLFVFLIFIQAIQSEVAIKESVVDPFQILIENQKLILEKIAGLEGKVNNETLNQKREYSENSLIDEKLKNIEENLAILNTKISNLTDSVEYFTSNHSDHDLNNNILKFSTSENFINLLEEIKLEIKTISSKNIVSKESPAKATRSVTTITSFPPINNSTKINTHKYEGTETLKIPFQDTTIFNSKFANLNETLHTIIGLIYRVEYRQRINKLARDKILDIVLRRIAAHQNVIDEHFTNTLENEIQSLKRHWTLEVEEMKERLSFDNEVLLNTMTQIASNAKSDARFHEKDEVIEGDTITKLHFNDTISIENDSFAGGALGSSDNKTFEGGNIATTYLFVVNETVNSSQINKETEKDEVVPFYNSINDIIQHQNQDEDLANCIEVIEEKRNLTEIQLSEMEALFKGELKQIKERIQGLLIYEDSKQHSLLKLIDSEFRKMENVISNKIGLIEDKLSNELIQTKGDLIAFVDAAVTSISSAAVTSAQATGFQISNTLKKLFNLALKEMQVTESSDSPKCPGLYQRVGSNCFLILDNIEIQWIQACRLCTSLGGHIATLTKEEQNILALLKNSKSKSLWLDSSSDETNYNKCEESKRLGDSVYAIDVLTNVLNSESKNCPALFDTWDSTDYYPCDKKFGVLCKYSFERKERNDFTNDISHHIEELKNLVRNPKY